MSLKTQTCFMYAVIAILLVYLITDKLLVVPTDMANVKCSCTTRNVSPRLPLLDRNVDTITTAVSSKEDSTTNHGPFNWFGLNQNTKIPLLKGSVDTTRTPSAVSSKEDSTTNHVSHNVFGLHQNTKIPLLKGSVDTTGTPSAVSNKVESTTNHVSRNVFDIHQNNKLDLPLVTGSVDTTSIPSAVSKKIDSTTNHMSHNVFDIHQNNQSKSPFLNRSVNNISRSVFNLDNSFPFTSVDNISKSLFTKEESTATCESCNVFDLHQNNNYTFDCVRMNFQPTTPICFYPTETDVYVSGSLRAHKTWEAGMVTSYQKWLSKNESIGVIDIGSNLGVYSLVAAAMGHNVLSVEPNIENIKRFHKSVKLGKLEERITLLQNAISDERGIGAIVYSQNNQGNTQIRTQPNSSLMNDKPHYSDEKQFTKMIIMNDLERFCKFEKAIMKIDIQGFEHRAFVQADVLFDGIDITHVLMEWDMMKKKFGQQKQTIERILVENMLDFFYNRDYEATTWNNKRLQRETWGQWPFDILWIKQYQA